MRPYEVVAFSTVLTAESNRTLVDARTGAVVLAAGKGTRMRTDEPKVLHMLLGRPMISLIAETLEALGFGFGAPRPVYVVGFGAEQVKAVLGPAAEFAIQAEQLGTGHAAQVGVSRLDSNVDRVLLIHGDEPLIEIETYREMLGRSRDSGAAIVLLTGEVSESHHLGRVLRDTSGRVEGLAQEAELTAEQHGIREINFGAYVFGRGFMEESFPKLSAHAGGEYYLTDLVRFAAEEGRLVETVSVPYPDDQMGINDGEQLARAEAFLRRNRPPPARTQ